MKRKETQLGRACHLVDARARRIVQEALASVTEEHPDLDAIIRMPERWEREGKNLLPALGEALAHDQPRARIWAAWFISTLHMREPRIIDDKAMVGEAERLLIDGLRTGTVDDRLWPCVLFASGNVPHAVEPVLRELLRDADERLRLCAAAALSTVAADIEDEDKRTANALSRTSAHSSRMERSQEDQILILRTLERGLALSHPALVGIAASAVARQRFRGASPVKKLTAALAAVGPHTKYPLLVAIGKLGTIAVEAAASIRPLLDDTRLSPELRGYALYVLAVVTSDSKTVLPELLRGVRSAEAPLVRGAIEGLKRIGHVPEEVGDWLTGYLGADDASLRLAALKGLEAMGPRAERALPALVARIGIESDRDAVVALVYALVAIGPPTIPLMLAILKSHDVVRVPIAAQTIAEMGCTGADALVRALDTETDEFVRGIMVVALRDMGPKARPALPKLAEILETTEDEELALYAIAAVFNTRCAGPEQAYGLLRWLIWGSDDTAQVAERTLREIGPAAVPIATQAMAGSDDEGRKRLLNLIRAITPEGEERYRRFRDVGNDAWIQTFVYVAEVLQDCGPMSLRGVEAELLRRQASGRVPARARVKSTTIGLHLRGLQETLGILTTYERRHHEGELTTLGRDTLLQARAYLDSRHVS